MNRKDSEKQGEIIRRWLKETQIAYKREDVSDGHIVSYLAQKELGYHTNISRRCGDCYGELTEVRPSKHQCDNKDCPRNIG